VLNEFAELEPKLRVRDLRETFLFDEDDAIMERSASQNVWQMELIVEQIRLLDDQLAATAAAVWKAHSDAEPLPRHGENSCLRRAYRVGRGDAITAVEPQ
jgi:hypothetical protein